MTRSNLDHSKCTHPRTAAGRAACRKARTTHASEKAINAAIAAGKATVQHVEDDSLPTITRKDAKANRGKWVRVTTRDNVIMSGQLVSWGPQVMTIVPDDATKKATGRDWKRDSISTIIIDIVEVQA